MVPFLHLECLDLEWVAGDPLVSFVCQLTVFKGSLPITIQTHLNTTYVISPPLCCCHSCKTPGPGKEHLIG